MGAKVQHGKSGAVLNGTITGHEYHDHVLRPRAGQTMAVKLTVDGTNGDGSAYFNILPTSSDNVAIFSSRGTVSNLGYVYLFNGKGSAYAVGTPSQAGVIVMKRYQAGSWE